MSAPRAGTILEGLRRHHDAEVYAMPIWESQQFIIEDLLISAVYR